MNKLLLSFVLMIGSVFGQSQSTTFGINPVLSSPVTVTPSELATEITNAFTQVYTALNNQAVVAYNKAVVQANLLDLPLPNAPTLTLVNGALIQQLEAQAQVNPSSVTPQQWSQILYTVVYLPMPTPPPTPVTITYTIGTQIAPGVFTVTDSNNSQIQDGTKFTTSDGHTYEAHWTTPFGSVVAQMIN